MGVSTNFSTSFIRNSHIFSPVRIQKPFFPNKWQQWHKGVVAMNHPLNLASNIFGFDINLRILLKEGEVLESLPTRAVWAGLIGRDSSGDRFKNRSQIVGLSRILFIVYYSFSLYFADQILVGDHSVVRSRTAGLLLFPCVCLPYLAWLPTKLTCHQS